MTLDGHLLLSHPAESWPACAPPVCAFVCLPAFFVALVQLLYSCVRTSLFMPTCTCIIRELMSSSVCVCVCVCVCEGYQEGEMLVLQMRVQVLVHVQHVFCARVQV